MGRCWQVFAADERHDLVGAHVRNRAFERLGRFDAHGAVIFGHHQQQAVANALAPNFPAVADPLGIGRNVFGLGGGHYQHHHLRAACLFKSRQLGFQRFALRGIECASAVHDMRRQGRDGLHALRPGTQAGERQPERQEQSRNQPATRLRQLAKQRRKHEAKGRVHRAAYFLLKSTTGGAEIWASLATAKLGLTL